MLAVFLGGVPGAEHFLNAIFSVVTITVSMTRLVESQLPLIKPQPVFLRLLLILMVCQLVRFLISVAILAVLPLLPIFLWLLLLFLWLFHVTIIRLLQLV